MSYRVDLSNVANSHLKNLAVRLNRLARDTIRTQVVDQPFGRTTNRKPL